MQIWQSHLGISGLFIASCVASVVYGESIYLNYPGPGTHWNPGANVAVRWSVHSGSGTPVQFLSLDIMNGDAANAVLVAPIASRIPAQFGLYNWIVPPSLESRRDYFIRATALAGQTSASHVYSGRFSIGGPVWAATSPIQPWQTLEIRQSVSNEQAGQVVLMHADANHGQQPLEDASTAIHEQNAIPKPPIETLAQSVDPLPPIVTVAPSSTLASSLSSTSSRIITTSVSAIETSKQTSDLSTATHPHPTKAPLEADTFPVLTAASIALVFLSLVL